VIRWLGSNQMSACGAARLNHEGTKDTNEGISRIARTTPPLCLRALAVQLSFFTARTASDVIDAMGGDILRDPVWHAADPLYLSRKRFPREERQSRCI
jgi:hypothetical protein